MKHFLAIAILLTLNPAFAEEWENDGNGLFRISFGPLHDYRDDFSVIHGKLTSNEWIYEEGSPQVFDLVSTKPIESFGTDTSRKYAIGVTLRIKADWIGPCFVHSIGHMFGLRMTYDTSDGVSHERRYALPLRDLPNNWCEESTGQAHANTDNKYKIYGLHVEDYKHVGAIKNLSVSLYGVTRDTSLYLPTIQFVLGHHGGRHNSSSIRRSIDLLEEISYRQYKK